MKKKLFAALYAAVLALSCSIPVSAEDAELDRACAQTEKIIRVILAENFAPERLTFTLQGVKPDSGSPYIQVWMYGHVTLYGDGRAKGPRHKEMEQYYSLFNPYLEKIGYSVNTLEEYKFYKESKVFPERSPYPLGDLNENGTVQLEDAEAALAAYTAAAGQLDTGLTETQSYAADPDGNGTLTLSDAQHILRYYTVNTLGQQNVSWVDIVVFGA